METQTTNGNGILDDLSVRFRQSSKGFYYAEWEVSARTMKELKKKNEELSEYVTSECLKLNQGGERNE